MTRSLAPLYLAAGMVAGLWGAPSRDDSHAAPMNRCESPEPTAMVSEASRLRSPPLGSREGGILSQLDALDARIAALAYPDPRHCDDACLTGVERVELRRGVVSCRCRKLPSLGVHRLPEAP